MKYHIYCSSKDMLEASNRVCSSSYNVADLQNMSTTRVPPCTSKVVALLCKNKMNVLQSRKSNLTILKSWSCHAKTTRKLQSTAPAPKIQSYDFEVMALRENNLKVTKYCLWQHSMMLTFQRSSTWMNVS